MQIQIRLDGSAVRLWHVHLLERLANRADTIVTIDDAPGTTGLPGMADVLFRLETAIHGVARPGLATRAEPQALAAYKAGEGRPDLILDLCGDVRAATGVWHLAFDTMPGEAGLLSALLSGRAPVAAIRDGVSMVAMGRLGTESPGVALSAFEDGLARTLTLIVAALDGAASKTLPSSETEQAAATPLRLGLKETGKIAAKACARMLVRRLYYLVYRAPHWRTGWRRIAGTDLIDLRAHPKEGWIDLPDDGHRFYADPFPFEHDGTVTLFVEEFDHHRQKGIISAVAFGADGPLGRPEPVLDLPYHLSYPFVFERDGAIWMIPESCAAGTIDLYRATDFPRGWVHEARLVDDVVASDATLVQHVGRWWLFATVQDAGGAFSDALHLWSAPDFRGPWTPHRKNPVLIDIASARPAGRIVEKNGALIRPVQDCRKGYGNALGLARILRLDDEGFEQVVETTLHAGERWPGRRLHTLNEAGGLEFIDGSAHARRWRLAP